MGVDLNATAVNVSIISVSYLYFVAINASFLRGCNTAEKGEPCAPQYSTPSYFYKTNATSGSEVFAIRSPCARQNDIAKATWLRTHRSGVFEEYYDLCREHWIIKTREHIRGIDYYD